MSSLAKEFYEDGSKKLSSTPYDLDSYNTGVGLKRNDWRTLCESTSPWTLPEFACKRNLNHRTVHPSSFQMPFCCTRCEKIQVCPKCQVKPYSLFQKFLSAPYTRYSPKKDKKPRSLKNTEVQTQKQNINSFRNIEPPRPLIHKNHPQQYFVPNNIVIPQNQQPIYQYQRSPIPQTIKYVNHPQTSTNFLNIPYQKPQVLVNNPSTTSLFCPPPPQVVYHESQSNIQSPKFEGRTSIIDRINVSHNLTNPLLKEEKEGKEESKSSSRILTNTELEESEPKSPIKKQTDSVEIVKKNLHRKPKGLKMFASTNSEQRHMSVEKTDSQNHKPSKLSLFEENPDNESSYIAKNITDSDTYQQQIMESTSETHQSQTITMSEKRSENKYQKSMAKFSAQSAIEEEVEGEDQFSDR